MIENHNLPAAQQLSDSRNLNTIRAAAGKNPNSPAAMKAAAQQFEALFVNIMLKSMRETVPLDSLFNTPHTKLYTQLFDEELSQQIAKDGSIGLADQIFRGMVATGQLDKDEAAPYMSKRRISASVDAYRAMAPGLTQNRISPGQAPHFRSESRSADGVVPAHRMSQTRLNENATAPVHVKAFMDKMMSHAHHASQTTGIVPEFMIAQAALESGWGRHEIRLPNGRPSHNLFGIKANGWNGRTVDVLTTEFENGQMVKKVEKFRAYDSYAEAFRDYARLLSENPRYRDVLNTTNPAAFAYGLQQAGYATDPEYGSKLMQVIDRVTQGA